MQNLDLLKQVASGIYKLLGQHCEIVIHDFSDLEHSIVHLEGNVTGRSVRGAATDLILSHVRQGTTDQDVYNYQTQLSNGRNGLSDGTGSFSNTSRAAPATLPC